MNRMGKRIARHTAKCRGTLYARSGACTWALHMHMRLDMVCEETEHVCLCDKTKVKKWCTFLRNGIEMVWMHFLLRLQSSTSCSRCAYIWCYLSRQLIFCCCCCKTKRNTNWNYINNNNRNKYSGEKSSAWSKACFRFEEFMEDAYMNAFSTLNVLNVADLIQYDQR